MIGSLVLGSIVDAVLHVLVLLAVPPLLQGVIVKTKARFGGRVGAPVLQPYFDLEMRLGEGTGSALCIGLVKAATKIVGEMATFKTAGVTERSL